MSKVYPISSRLVLSWCISYLALGIIACEGPRLYDCPDQTILGIDAALATWDSSSEIVARADIHCQEKPPFPSAPCVTWWYGKGTIPGQRAKIVVQSDLAGPCMIHELHHGSLYVDFGDGCTLHKTECGWNIFEIEEANALFKSLLESENK